MKLISLNTAHDSAERESFIWEGTAALVKKGGRGLCSAWRGRDGLFHHFQELASLGRSDWRALQLPARLRGGWIGTAGESTLERRQGIRPIAFSAEFLMGAFGSAAGNAHRVFLNAHSTRKTLLQYTLTHETPINYPSNCYNFQPGTTWKNQLSEQALLESLK